MPGDWGLCLKCTKAALIREDPEKYLPQPKNEQKLFNNGLQEFIKKIEDIPKMTAKEFCDWVPMELLDSIDINKTEEVPSHHSPLEYTRFRNYLSWGCD